MTAKITGKKITLPSLSLMEGESRVETVTFVLDRYYNDVDLSDLTGFVNLLRSDGSTDKVELEVETDEEEITATWVIDGGATACPGELGVQVSFVSEDGSVVFATEKVSMEVGASIDAYRDMVNHSPSAVYRLRQIINTYVSATDSAIGDVNDRLDGLAAVATSGSYSDLTGKPNLTNYVTNTNLSLVLSNVIKPTYLKYVSLTDNPSVILALSAENKTALGNWYNASSQIGGWMPIMLWSQTGDFYFATQISETSTQVGITFKKGNGNYYAFYSKSTGNFSFSE